MNLLLSIPIKALYDTYNIFKTIYPRPPNLVQISFVQKISIPKPTSNANSNNFNSAMITRTPNAVAPKLYPTHHP